MLRLLTLMVSAAALAVLATPAHAQWGTISELSAVGNDAPRCSHNVPEQVCTRHNPELEQQFREVGDWCRGHRIPESQCWRCHPDLDFDPMPEVPDNADIDDLTEEQALAGLEAQVVEGHVTVMFFTANWCANCRNVEARLRTHLDRDNRLAVRRVHVNEWEGPVVDAYLSRVRGLPYVIVYGADGERVDDMAAFELSELDELLVGTLGPAPTSNPTADDSPEPGPESTD